MPTLPGHSGNRSKSRFSRLDLVSKLGTRFSALPQGNHFFQKRHVFWGLGVQPSLSGVIFFKNDTYFCYCPVFCLLVEKGGHHNREDFEQHSKSAGSGWTRAGSGWIWLDSARIWTDSAGSGPSPAGSCQNPARSGPDPADF